MKAQKVYENIGDVLKPKTEEEIHNALDEIGFDDYDYAVAQALGYGNNHMITNDKSFRRRGRRMMVKGFKNKKSPFDVAKEVLKTYKKHLERRKDYKRLQALFDIKESISDVLKPKDFKSLFAKHGITDDEITFRHRSQMDMLDSVKSISNGAGTRYEYTKDNSTFQDGIIVNVSGKPENVFKYFLNSFLPERRSMTIDQKIESMKKRLV